MHSCSRYDSTTGVSTVPDAGAGLHYMSTHLVLHNKVLARFSMYRNDKILSAFHEDNQNIDNGNGAGSCSVTIKLNAGKDN